MRATGKAHTLRGLFALALFFGVGSGCFALGYEFDQEVRKCTESAQCPQVNSLCGAWTCEEQVCVFATKEPPDDGNPCTKNLCDANNNPTYEPAEQGTLCGATKTLTCDGKGVCKGCAKDEDCQIADPCAFWTCDEAKAECTRILKPAGTFISDEATKDCKALYCNAAGQPELAPYSDDVKDDGNACTAESCQDGEPVASGPVSDGTPCEEGCKMCVNGTCVGCDALPNKYKCNTSVNQCVSLQQLPDGSGCSTEFDCASGFCADGVCCDSACDSACKACTTGKTGQANGVCSNITNGTDPDKDCESPGPDVCLNGQCQCYNGVKDGNELKVDCGGSCTPCVGKWECSGSPACEMGPNYYCCGVGCSGLCSNQVDACKSLHGQPCIIGQDQPKSFNLKTIVPKADCNVLGDNSACVVSNCVCQ